MNKDKWKWYGRAGHFILGNYCRFHLCTVVGHYVVSTVGELLPDESVREIYAKSKGIRLVGRGDARLADYMRKIGYEEVGDERKYETYVFRFRGQYCRLETCNCGMPCPSDHSEVDSLPANDASTATANHEKLCKKWASRKTE